MKNLTLRTITTIVLGVSCALAGCGSDSVSDSEAKDEAVKSGSPSGGKADLPNDTLWRREHDGVPYGVIARRFGDDGHDLRVQLDQLQARWPLENGETALLTRFGTPLIVDGAIGYFHTALDVLRSDPSASDTVVAPFAGKARVFNWDGQPGFPGKPYVTVVAVWDPKSHVVAELTHVLPNDTLLAIGSGEVDVTAGEVLGTLADVPFVDPDRNEEFRHTHFNLIDGDALIALDPGKFVPYQDHVPPTAVDLYFLDDKAKRHEGFVDGPLDVVVEVFDRDDDSNRNFEVDAIAFTITDDLGNTLAGSEFCEFDDLLSSIAEPHYSHALSLLDLGTAQQFLGRGGISGSNIGHRERTFRYALTQFFINAEGKCDVVDDQKGFIEVAPVAQRLTITGTLRDVLGNEQPFSFSRDRKLQDSNQ